MQKLLTFFSKNISVHAIFNDQSLNDALTNNIVSFEQLGPDWYTICSLHGLRDDEECILVKHIYFSDG